MDENDSSFAELGDMVPQVNRDLDFVREDELRVAAVEKYLETMRQVMPPELFDAEPKQPCTASVKATRSLGDLCEQILKITAAEWMDQEFRPLCQVIVHEFRCRVWVAHHFR